MIRIVKLFGWMVLLATALMGCSSNAVKIVPVEGKILFADGKPLPTGTRLIFVPSVGNMGNAIGVTDEAGNFKAKHQSGSEGAALGKYTVQIAAPEGEKNDFFKIVPRKYFDDGGILTVEVIDAMSPLNLVVKK